MHEALEIKRGDLMKEPEVRKLISGKSYFVFKTYLSTILGTAQAGRNFVYKGKLYGVEKTTPHNASPENYVALNCLLLGKTYL